MREVKTEASSGVYVFHAAQQTLDLVEYSWVPLFIKDKTLRAEMATLEAEILSTQNSLISVGELRERFEGQRAAIKTEFLELTAASLGQVQARKGNLFDTVIPQQLRLVPLIFLSPEDVDKIFSSLLQGVRQVDIEKKVLKLQKRIEEIQQEIDRDLSPKSRWYYTPAGDPEPYSKGCRWEEVVGQWEQEASRCSGECNFRGEKPNEAEKTAYHLLKLGEVMKIDPLREPQL